MKKLFFLLCLLPLSATAQTVKQKVLYMKAVRTNGSTSARLEGTDDFLGPIFNLETRKFTINGTTRTLNTIKEIRFEIQEEELPDGIDAVEEDEDFTTIPAAQPTFDLSGRKVEEQKASRGIYIKGGRKFIKN